MSKKQLIVNRNEWIRAIAHQLPDLAKMGDLTHPFGAPDQAIRVTGCMVNHGVEEHTLYFQVITFHLGKRRHRCYKMLGDIEVFLTDADPRSIVLAETELRC